MVVIATSSPFQWVSHPLFRLLVIGEAAPLSSVLSVCYDTSHFYHKITLAELAGSLFTNISMEDRCVGSLLCHMIGDQLGAGVEGYSASRIKYDYGTVRDDIEAPHMGVYELGPRLHMYTDDTNAMLALAHSLVVNGGLKPKHAAISYAEFWTMGIKRGYPDSAQASMRCVLEGKSDYRECGRIAFPDGSFANGGAMRIVPVALAFRQASDEELYRAVKMAIISSHVHPEGIDGAFVLAKAIIFALRCPSIEEFDPYQFLEILRSTARTKGMKNQLKKLVEFYTQQHKTDRKGAQQKRTDVEVVRALGDTFQIKAIDAVPCALWIICDSYREPEECLIRGVNMGGDTDTVAAMIGDMVGALHGWQWIPARWFENIEPNSEANLNRGKEFAIELAKKLATMNLNCVLNDDS